MIGHWLLVYHQVGTMIQLWISRETARVLLMTTIQRVIEIMMYIIKLRMLCIENYQIVEGIDKNFDVTTDGDL